MYKGKIGPPLYLLCTLLLQILVGKTWPIYTFSTGLSLASGRILIVVGLFLGISAIALFKRKQTTVKPFHESQQLITTGPFRWSRNPIYLGMFFILLGQVLYQGAFSALVFPFVFYFIINKHVIPWEEDSLKQTFGQPFLDYMNKVKRWL